jgi:hypothetical protein
MKDVSSCSRDIDLSNARKNLMSICEATWRIRRKIMGSALRDTLRRGAADSERGYGVALTATNKPGLSMSMYLSSHTTTKSLITRRVSCKATPFPWNDFLVKNRGCLPRGMLWQGTRAKPTHLLTLREGILLFQRSVSVRCGAVVIITHAPSHRDACLSS